MFRDLTFLSQIKHDPEPSLVREYQASLLKGTADVPGVLASTHIQEWPQVSVHKITALHACKLSGSPECGNLAPCSQDLWSLSPLGFFLSPESQGVTQSKIPSLGGDTLPDGQLFPFPPPLQLPPSPLNTPPPAVPATIHRVSKIIRKRSGGEEALLQAMFLKIQ